MDFFEVVKKRGSYRGEFTAEGVPMEDMGTILDAGIRAPSGYNLQTTTFYVVTTPALRAALAEIFPTAATRTAPVILVAASKCVHGGTHDLQFETEDYAAAVENVMLAITALGYAGVWMDGMMKFEGNADRVRQLLQLPANERPRTIIPFGHPKTQVRQKQKKPFAERVHIL